MLVQKLWGSRGPGNVVVLTVTTHFINTTLKAGFLGTILEWCREKGQSTSHLLTHCHLIYAYREGGGRCVCLKTGVWWHLEHWFSSHTLHHHLKSSHSLVIWCIYDSDQWEVLNFRNTFSVPTSRKCFCYSQCVCVCVCVRAFFHIMLYVYCFGRTVHICIEIRILHLG